MRYEIQDKVVTFFLENRRRDDDDTRKASFEGTSLKSEQITPMLDATVDWKRGQSLPSQEMAVKLLANFFAGFRALGLVWPTNSQDHALVLLHFFQWYLTTTESSATTATRAKMWSSCYVPWLQFLKDADVIPLDAVVPVIQRKKLISLGSHAKTLLGKGGRPLVEQTAPVQKLLVDVSFGMSDADYLDSLEQQCRHLIGVVKEVCLGHWRGVMKDAETGRELASKVSDEMIDQATQEGRFGDWLVKNGRNQIFIKYASSNHPLGISWALAWVRRTLENGITRDCISPDAMRQTSFFNARTFLDKASSYPVLESLTSMEPEQWKLLPSSSRFSRFAGMLSSMDAAAACALLTIEHPQFTPESLQNAVLLNVRGKPRILMTDSVERSILSIDKPRAGKFKSAALSELAQEIVNDIIRVTTLVRKVLKRAGDKRWRYLFLGVVNDYPNGRVGILSVLDASTRYLNGYRSVINLARLNPVLGQNGLGPGTFDYRKLRNTLGVLRWFDTGSILEMSRELGNTRKVALEHYLPSALLHAWNTRIIRRFQNTLIVLAAHDEPYLLEVSDFSKLADLQHFIAQLILDYPANTSPLADEVQRLLRSASQSPSAVSASSQGLLNIRLSSKSLAYLYAFHDLAQKTLAPEQQDKVDALSGLSPRQFMDMAKLLTHAAENTELHPALRDSLDVTRLMVCHGQAMALKGEIYARFSKLALQRNWEMV